MGDTETQYSLVQLDMLHFGHVGSQLPVPGGAGGADEHAKVVRRPFWI